MKEPVDHILRPRLPWRGDESAITECGYDASKVKTLSRDEYFQRVKELGRQRTAMLTCMTCADTAGRWGTWEKDPRRALEREINWECTRWHEDRGRGQRLRDELLAIATLIEMHGEEFASLVAATEQRREWLEKKAEHDAAKAKPKTVTQLIR